MAGRVFKGLFAVFICVVSVLQAGCEPAPLPLRIGSNLWPGYEPLYAARELGYLNTERIKLVELPSASDVMDSIRLGNLEGGALTLDETLSLIAEGEDMVVILVFDISAGADMLLVRDNIHTLPELAGRNIAVETTAVGALMVKSALDMAGLNATQVNIIHMPLTDHLAAFRAHRIDAAVTFEPFATELKNAGAHVLFDSTAIQGQIVDVLAVKRSAINERLSDLRHLLRAYYQVHEAIRTAPDSVMPVLNMRLKTVADEVPHLLDGLQLPDAELNRELLSGSPAPLERTAQQLATVMLRQKLLPKSLLVNDMTQVIEPEAP